MYGGFQGGPELGPPDAGTTSLTSSVSWQGRRQAWRRERSLQAVSTSPLSVNLNQQNNVSSLNKFNK